MNKYRPTVESLESRSVPSHLIFHPHNVHVPHHPAPHVTVPAPTPSSLPTVPLSQLFLNINMPSITLPNGTVAPKMATETADEQVVVDAINQQRQLAGLSPLTVDTRLVAAADIGAEYAASTMNVAHYFPGQLLSTPAWRLLYVQYNIAGSGENAAGGYPSSEVVQAWMNSPLHKQNVLGVNYTNVGIGEAYDSHGTLYVFADFGQPIPADFSPTVFVTL